MKTLARARALSLWRFLRQSLPPPFWLPNHNTAGAIFQARLASTHVSKKR